MGDDFDAETFGDRSMTNVGSQMGQDALKSHMNKFFNAADHNASAKSKGLGYLSSMTANKPLRPMIDPVAADLLVRTIGSDSLARGDSSVGTEIPEKSVNPTGKILRMRTKRFSSLTNSKIQEEDDDDLLDEDDMARADIDLGMLKSSETPLKRLDDDMISVLSKQIPYLNAPS
jgi:hypothetical protein